MRSAQYILAAVIALSSASFAVDVPNVVKRDKPIAIDHEAGEKINAIFGAVENGVFVWRYLPDDHFIREELRTFFAAPPGEYIVVIGESQIIKVIEEGRPEPRPDPKPKPEPEPMPPPDGIRAEWLIWIEETEERTKHANQTFTMSDAGLMETISEIGLKKRVYDKDQPEAKEFIKLIDKPLPALIILGEDPRNYRVFDAPETPEDAEKLIRGAIIR